MKNYIPITITKPLVEEELFLSQDAYQKASFNVKITLEEFENTQKSSDLSNQNELDNLLLSKFSYVEGLCILSKKITSSDKDAVWFRLVVSCAILKPKYKNAPYSLEELYALSDKNGILEVQVFLEQHLICSPNYKEFIKEKLHRSNDVNIDIRIVHFSDVIHNASAPPVLLLDVILKLSKNVNNRTI